jgi:hypothetical protein
MTVAILTGISQVTHLGLSWSKARLTVKVTLVATAAALALAHQLTARASSASTRGTLQSLILLTSIGVYGAAVRLV